MLNRVRIVLIETSHPGNIGSVARAMKTMGLERLYLVNPKQPPNELSIARSSGAEDVLDTAITVDSLEEATRDCHLVIGASARSRHIPWPLMDPRQVAQMIVAESVEEQVALVFGREDRGLTNAELHACHFHVNIPATEDFSSLNLAAAVQVIAYELRMALLVGRNEDVKREDLPWGVEWDIEQATSEETERFFKHLESTLVAIKFLDPGNPRQLMARLRRLFLRSRPDRVEINILRGILTAVDKTQD